MKRRVFAPIALVQRRARDDRKRLRARYFTSNEFHRGYLAAVDDLPTCATVPKLLKRIDSLRASVVRLRRQFVLLAATGEGVPQTADSMLDFLEGQLGGYTRTLEHLRDYLGYPRHADLLQWFSSEYSDGLDDI